jgi:hypothetical protein
MCQDPIQRKISCDSFSPPRYGPGRLYNDAQYGNEERVGEGS